MPRRKMKGGRTIGGINPVARSNMMAIPQVPTPMSTWEKIKNFAKQHKIVSRSLKAVSGMVGDKYSPLVNAGASLAESYGYGRKRKQRGGLYEQWRTFGDDKKFIDKFRRPKFPTMKGSGQFVRF